MELTGELSKVASNVQNTKKSIVFLHRENPILKKRLDSGKMFIDPLVHDFKLPRRNLSSLDAFPPNSLVN